MYKYKMENTSEGIRGNWARNEAPKFCKACAQT